MGAIHRGRLGAHVLILALYGLLACAGGRGGPIFDLPDWNLLMGTYAEAPKHRSMAVAPSPLVMFWGRSSGFRSEAAAVNRALDECEAAIAKVETRSGSAPDRLVCKLFAVDERVVWEFLEPTPEIVRSCRSLPEVQGYLAAAREEIWELWGGTQYGLPTDTVELELTLNRIGSLQGVRVLEAPSPKEAEEARRMAEWTAPFFPLFGVLSCLAGQPIRMQWDPE